MTHHQALAGNRAGLEPSTCPGHLDYLESWPGHPEPGQLVTLYQCDRCGHRVSVARQIDADGTHRTRGLVLNDYHPDPRATIAALAELWDAKPLLAVSREED